MKKRMILMVVLVVFSSLITFDTIADNKTITLSGWSDTEVVLSPKNSEIGCQMKNKRAACYGILLKDAESNGTAIGNVLFLPAAFNKVDEALGIGNADLEANAKELLAYLVYGIQQSKTADLPIDTMSVEASPLNYIDKQFKLSTFTANGGDSEVDVLVGGITLTVKTQIRPSSGWQVTREANFNIGLN